MLVCAHPDILNDIFSSHPYLRGEANSRRLPVLWLLGTITLLLYKAFGPGNVSYLRFFQSACYS